jgi:hypothetical protein
MNWVFLFLLPTVVFAMFGVISPRVGPPPRWQVRAGRLLAWLTEPLRREVARRRRRRPEPADPFDALKLQMRLGVVADQVRALESDAQVYAKAHRLQATRAAYDDLLGEACRMAGIQPVPETRRSEGERLREEVELASRGWSW